MMWLVAGAMAASWSVAEPLLPVLGADGRVEQPAGVAFRIEGTGDAAPQVMDASGQAVTTLPVDGGWLIPAPDRSRALSVVVARPETVRFRSSAAPTEITAWMTWEHDTWRALHVGGAVPVPPGDDERIAASISLRAAAVADRDIVWIGALHDTVEARPWSKVTHVPGVETAAPAEVVGPGMAIVRVKLPTGALRRIEIVPRLDGIALTPVPAASTGAGVLSLRVWVPPGRHRIGADVVGATPERVSVQSMPLRPTVTRPVHAPDHPTGIDQAEWLWLAGEREAARTAFAAYRAETGPRGELARARLLALATTYDEALAQVTPSSGTSRDGLELLADAALRVAPLLPPGTVLARLRDARDPDLVLVARWLDQLGGTRPRGVSLLLAAAAENPTGSDYAAWSVRAAGVSARWSRLDPEPGAITLPPTYADVGPGISRQRIAAGETARVTLPVVPRGRFPVLRMTALGHTQATLDGVPLVTPGGPLDHALTPGEHTLTVTEGAILVLDPKVVEGGAKVWEWTLARLPTTWTLPDAGWEGEVRINVVPAVPVSLSVGARTMTLSPRADGSYPTVAVHRGETTLRLDGPPDTGALVALRSGLPPETEVPQIPTGDEAWGLDQLRALTAAIDGGDLGARERRALVLAGLGQLTAARRDLLRVPRETVADVLRVTSLWDTLAPVVPSAGVAGPRSVAAVLARAGIVSPAPADKDQLAALAEQTGSAYLWSVVAQARLAADDLVGATLAANLADDPDRETLDAIEQRTKWSSVSLPDRAAGVVAVPVERRRMGGFWREAREAMLGAPWPDAEVEILRGATHDVARFSGRTLHVEVFCRDEAAVVAPCVVPIRVGDRADTLQIADGRSDARLYTLDAGRHELDVGGPGAGRAAVVRVTVDGEVLAPARSRRALVAASGMPVEVTVGGPALVRVRSVRGTAYSPVGPVRPGEPARIVPVVATGPQTVRFTGDADLLVDVGNLDAPAVATPAPEAPAPPAPLLSDAELQAVVDPLVRALPPLRLPGDGPTFRAALSYHHESVQPPDRTWDTVELDLAVLRATPRMWWWGEGWLRGPAPAGGGVVEGGYAWATGRASVEARGGWGASVPAGAVGAGHVQLQAHVREDLPVTPSDQLRGQLRLRGGVWSAPADARVDLRAWTRWDADHPFFAEATVGWMGQRWTDLRLAVGLRALSNSFGDPVPLDAFGPYAAIDLRLGRDWVVDLDGSLRRRFADDHRVLSTWSTEAELGLRKGLWDRKARYWQAFADVALVDLEPEVHVGLSVWFTQGRGLHDLPPGDVSFRTARDLSW